MKQDKTDNKKKDNERVAIVGSRNKKSMDDFAREEGKKDQDLIREILEGNYEGNSDNDSPGVDLGEDLEDVSELDIIHLDPEPDDSEKPKVPEVPEVPEEDDYGATLADIDFDSLLDDLPGDSKSDKPFNFKDITFDELDHLGKDTLNPLDNLPSSKRQRGSVPKSKPRPPRDPKLPTELLVYALYDKNGLDLSKQGFDKSSSVSVIGAFDMYTNEHKLLATPTAEVLDLKWIDSKGLFYCGKDKQVTQLLTEKGQRFDDLIYSSDKELYSLEFIPQSGLVVGGESGLLRVVLTKDNKKVDKRFTDEILEKKLIRSMKYVSGSGLFVIFDYFGFLTTRKSKIVCLGEFNKSSFELLNSNNRIYSVESLPLTKTLCVSSDKGIYKLTVDSVFSKNNSIVTTKLSIRNSPSHALKWVQNYSASGSAIGLLDGNVDGNIRKSILNQKSSASSLMDLGGSVTALEYVRYFKKPNDK
ncbi:hypothetical protein HOK51_07560 [Candidatus Woesearchaeota archaeon]|jgi:hypothetical protein|nr:hypothetical protein [Candidatus Woesearchaeota archaeon]MBT6519680.1 hypothetical protein [Candidatus Woesearchaeota archaeon]MBT7367371.1 hypothetical protein [Candidatus Woesearchaeota archaeon]